MKKLIYLLFILIAVCYSSQAQEAFQEFHKNGEIAFQGYKLNGKIEGEYTSFYKTGNIKSIARYYAGFVVQKKEYYEAGGLKNTMYFIDGSQHFKVYYYYKNGQLEKEGKIDRNGTKHGEWTYFSENNELIKTVDFSKNNTSN